ncbi:MAG TPA: WYL domain-containing protein [Acidimicrobiales bacterium]|nr:WYL domain-containing protein [Acidimicrobiales bacterium]
MPQQDRLERVTDLLLVLLDTTRPLSLREIADRVPGYPEGHDARRQAFERDKALLRGEGVPVLTVPVEGEDQQGYRIDPGAYYLPDLGLDPDEQAALNVAVAGVHLGEPIGRRALTKLGVDSESPGREAVVPLVELPSSDLLPALSSLFDAVRQRASVTFSYRGAERRLHPAALRFRNGHWYLVGYDDERQGARTFRVDRIESAPRLGPSGSAVLPEGFDPDEAFRLTPWRFGVGEEVDVDVLVDGAEAGRVVAELGTEAVHEHRDRGAVVVRLTVTDTDALVTWVLDLLDHAEVLWPAPVRQMVLDRLQPLAAS